jgi:hypothetical protein
MSPDGGLRFEGPGDVRRRRGSLLVGAAALYATSLVLGHVGAPGWGGLVEQLLALWLLLCYAANAYPGSRRGTVFGDRSGLRVGSERVVERARIASAFLLSPEDPVVRIVRRWALPVDVRLESEEEARALLTALGLGLGESIATFSVWYGRRGRPLAAAAAAAVGVGALAIEAALGHGHSTVSTALIVAGTLAVVGLRSFARLDIGSDGLLLRRFGEQRFVSHDALAHAVGDSGSGIILSLRSGEALRLAMASVPLRDALVQRIEEARLAFAQDPSADGGEALVAPGGRAIDRWLRDVRALAGASDYRVTRLDEERLWRVVDDAAAPPATRAGAAVAIAALDQAERPRLRAAAEACAEPKLRVALTRVAEGASEAELEEALATLVESES